MKLAALLLLLTSMSLAQSADLQEVFNHAATGPMRTGPGIAVLVRDHGKTVFERPDGVTDLRTKTPITPTTNFRLASCTKQSTAMAIMVLVNDGKLRYGSRLTKISSECP